MPEPEAEERDRLIDGIHCDIRDHVAAIDELREELERLGAPQPQIVVRIVEVPNQTT